LEDVTPLPEPAPERSREPTMVAIPYPKAFEGLQRCGLCQHMTEREVALLVRLMESKHYAAGAVVKASGSEATGIEVVLSGLLEVRLATFAPRQIGPGGVHGTEAIFGAEASYHEVVAVEDSDVLAGTRSALMELVRTEPVLACKMLYALGEDLLGELERARERLAASSTAEKPEGPTS
jgi:CRP-like cAMP-binding protein